MTDTQEYSQHGHVFRPGPFSKRRAYWLNGHELHWRIGTRADHVPLSDIVALRIHAPDGGNLATKCVLRERSGRVHKINDVYWPRMTREEWRRWGRPQRSSPGFRALSFTLARRIRKANPSASLESGPSRTEWIASVAVALAVVAVILVGSILMIANQQLSFAALAFMGMAALQLPILWPIIRTRGPRALDPDSVQPAGSTPEGSEK